ncbi:MAG: hypothetical protein IPG72_03325 [Ardenticatenales bacterium]|jgi:hypothetical protein|nr:hypothetical protein [Ardenticatenales bacterium]
MRQLTALFDAPLPASAARRALAAAGFADADIDGFSTQAGESPSAGDPARRHGDLAAEIALRAARLAADPADGLAAAIAETLHARGVPATHAGDMAGRVAVGRGWLVGVVCPDRRAAKARLALLGAAPVALF